MNCPDPEKLIAYVLSNKENTCSEIALHLITCSECQNNVEIIHETILAEKNVSYVPAINVNMKRISDLTISLAGEMKEGFRNFATWVKDLVPTFDLTPASYAYATRALVTESPVSTPTRLSFNKTGENCILKLSLDIKPMGADVEVIQLDKTGVAVYPFSLTVKDSDTGDTLLNGKEFKFGAAVIRGVKKGRYKFVTYSINKKCEFSLTVE